MQHPAAAVLDDEEAVEQLERHCRHGEEVERHDHFAVIRQEGQPALTGTATASDAAQVASYGSFGDDETQLLELAVDLGRAQLGFSCAKRRISTRISVVVFGLPLGARDRHLQKSRKPARCQPTTVCDFTTTSTSAQRDQTRRKAVQNSRSNGYNRGRGRFRLSTASCCRRARISVALSCRVRKKTRTAARGTRMNSSTELYVLPCATAPGPGSPSC